MTYEIKTEMINGKEYVLGTKGLKNIAEMEELLEDSQTIQDLKQIKTVLKKLQMLNTKMFRHEVRRMGTI